MIANYHTHTPRCHHAVGQEEEYIQHALAAGIRILGFSDHSPYIFPGDYYSGFRMRPEELPGYVDTVLSLREKYSGQIQIHLGLELEHYPAYFRDVLPILRDQPIEYLLLGQHFVGNEIGGHYTGWATEQEEPLKTYCYNMMDAMNTGLFTYFAHPDLVHFVGDDKLYSHYMGQLCREAKACGVPLEINLLGLAEGRWYPRWRFWELTAQEGNQVILGRDAHDPKAFLDKAAEAFALEKVRELGLNLIQTVPLRPVK